MRRRAHLKSIPERLKKNCSRLAARAFGVPKALPPTNGCGVSENATHGPANTLQSPCDLTVLRPKRGMRLVRLLFLSCLFLSFSSSIRLYADSLLPPTGRIVKVLPLFLDTNNVVAPSPSLFDRDAYQFYLLEHTNDIAGLRFDVEWKAGHARGQNLTLRVQIRGVGPHGLPTQALLEQVVTPRFLHHWTSLALTGAGYRKIGELAAWRATLWDGPQLLGQQQSFLWQSP